MSLTVVSLATAPSSKLDLEPLEVGFVLYDFNKRLFTKKYILVVYQIIIRMYRSDGEEFPFVSHS